MLLLCRKQASNNFSASKATTIKPRKITTTATAARVETITTTATGPRNICLVKCRKMLPGNCQLSRAQLNGWAGTWGVVAGATGDAAAAAVVLATASCQLLCVALCVCVGSVQTWNCIMRVCLSRQTNREWEREREEKRKQSMQHFAAQNLRVLQLPY